MCPLVMCVLKVPLLLPEELSPHSSCLSTLNTPAQVWSLTLQSLCAPKPFAATLECRAKALPAQTSDSWDSALVSRCSSNPRTTPALSGGVTETQRGEGPGSHSKAQDEGPRSQSKAKMRAQLTPLPGHHLSPGHAALLTPGLCPCPAPAARGGRGPRSSLGIKEQIPFIHRARGSKMQGPYGEVRQ